MSFSLRQLASRLLNRQPRTIAPLDPLAAFRTGDGVLSMTIQSCILSDGSMLIKAPGLRGFAIGLATPPSEPDLKAIISTGFKEKLMLSHNISENAYSFEFTALPDENGYIVRMQPLARPQPPSPPKL